MPEMRLNDAAAREAIRTRLDRNFLVEAGAGSGKTHSLVERMVALVGSGRCGIESLAAVTFTRKAAGELRERFQNRLERAVSEAADPQLEQRLRTARERLDRAFIGTIHSFCSRLLRERPVEAGINPGFTEIEGVEERLLEERAWQEYLLQVRLDRPQLLESLKKLDITPHELKDTYRQLVNYPDVDMVVRAAPYPDLDLVRKELTRLCHLAEMRLPEKPDAARGWDKLQVLMRTALQWQKTFNLSNDRYLLRLLNRLNRNATPVLKRWPKKEHAREVEEAFNRFKQTVAEPALKGWQEFRHKPLMDFLQPAAEYCRRLRERENALNFQDLLMRAAALLKDNPEVRGYFQKRYSHLLVDEFQDTDPIQAEVMIYLAGNEPAEKDWTRLTPRPGSLFVVGDPKQSIYRFRRADINTYNQVKRQIKHTGGEILYLTTNFRSLPELLHWSNPTFDSLFAEAVPPYQAEFKEMDSFRHSNPSNDGGLIVQQLNCESRKNADLVREDAGRIAAWISRALQGEMKLARAGDKAAGNRPLPEDFLVLVWYKKEMALYARELEQLGISFTLSGGSDISGSRELWELFYLLQALADPGNPLPLVAALRGIFFGLSDDLLYRFKLAGGQFNLLKAIPVGLEPATAELFNGAWQRLRLFYRWCKELPPSAALERIIGELGLLPFALSGKMGKGQAGYIYHALELIRRHEENGRTAFTEAVDYLAQLLENGVEEALDLEGGKSAGVRIMNLHKAKGLEAPVVILANPAGRRTHQPELHIRRDGPRSHGYFLVQGLKDNYGNCALLARPPDWDCCREREERYQEAEEIRLLYVAATRAKDILLVSTFPKRPQSSPWFPLEPYLEEAALLEQLSPAPPVTDSGSAGTITPALKAAAKETIQAGLEHIRAATYENASVSELTGVQQQAPPQRQIAGRGVSWGNVVHGALERLARDGERELDELAAELLEREGRPAGERQQFVELLRKVMESPLWRRAAAAAEKLVEIPFGMWEEGRYLTGIVDLAFKEEDGWVLVDYKSDVVDHADEKHLPQLADYYRPQVEEYARCWTRVTGEPVREYGLYFTDALAYIPWHA